MDGMIYELDFFKEKKSFEFCIYFESILKIMKILLT